MTLPKRATWLCAVAFAVFGSLPADGIAELAAVQIVAHDITVRTKIDTALARTREVHDVQSRGERTRLLVETVENPAAIAVLFAGGKGAMRLSEEGDIGLKNGFDPPTASPRPLSW